MSDELVFMMGTAEARFPTDRGYARNHMWLLPDPVSPDLHRVGLTEYSVRLLRDVYFLDWSIDPGTPVATKQEIGEIESSKALSSLYVPFPGEVVAFNEALLQDPSAINTFPYGDGWLFSLRTDSELLTPQEYLDHVNAGWKDAQHLIKKQMNE
ncbi:Glycine cleavage system H protein [Planctomycetes bacterium Pan216]|uniref:Glycine cleavage system H protein n=1 Tax=Kolteria novifilia TaxID=2527975 RepID=A0A518B235_9BACT|nr:Glycine cleavage system H protein [Planctomycetes bacterium Pan216]